MKATVHAHLFNFGWIEIEVTVLIWILLISHTQRGLAWRSPMEVHWPRAHLSVTNRSSKGRPTSKEKNKMLRRRRGKKKQTPLLFFTQTQAQVVDTRSREGELAGSLSLLEVHRSLCQPWCRWYLLRSSSFLKTDGSTSQETSERATCRKNVQLFPTTTATTFL